MNCDDLCMKCGARLSADEVGLHKRLINRGATEFMCINCLSVKFGVTAEKLRGLIEHYRRGGCSLFT